MYVSAYCGPDPKDRTYSCPDNLKHKRWGLRSHNEYEGPRRKRRMRCRFCKKKLEYVSHAIGNLNFYDANHRD